MSAPPRMDAGEVLARSGRTFHLASRLLPRQMREDAAALYAFCRAMDDLADGGEPGAAAPEHGALADALAALRRDPSSPEAAAMGWPVELEARFPYLSRIAVRLTEALAADAGPCRIATQAALQQYAFGVAGTVGLMMCRILGAPPEGAEAASHLGIAMQMSNIVRDVAEDFGRDRIYLPSVWIAPEQVAAALAGGDPAPLIAATRRLLALADEFYADAEAGMHYLPSRARLGIRAAAACYREIGVAVSRDVEASWQTRIVVGPGRKAALVADAFRRTLIRAAPPSLRRRDHEA